MHTATPLLYTGSTVDRLRRFERRARMVGRTVESHARQAGASPAVCALAAALDRARECERQARRLDLPYDEARELREGVLYLAGLHAAQATPLGV